MRRPMVLLAAGLCLLAPAGCGPADPARAERTTASSTSAQEGTTTVAFLGDSYTVGQGAGAGYVPRAAAELGWTAVNLGQAGTGYVAQGMVPEAQAPYGDRVAEVLAADPDVVVVQGSTNDVGLPLDDVAAAARDLYARLTDAIEPDRVVVLGPLAPPGVDGAGVREVRDVLAEAAADAGLVFIDPVREAWLTPPEGLFADPIHPDDAGYRELADELVEALRERGF